MLRGDDMKEFMELQEKYLKKFGNDSLDRVVLLDPLHPEENDYKKATLTLEKAIRENKPLEQIPEEIWEKMVF